jgi:hypothetical protein
MLTVYAAFVPVANAGQHQVEVGEPLSLSLAYLVKSSATLEHRSLLQRGVSGALCVAKL